MKAIYNNRYNDEIIFEQNEDEITMRGYNSDWMRCGYANKESGDTDYDTINMVDPSGGPYITIGSDLGLFYGDGIKRVVKSITINPLNVVFKIDIAKT